MVKINVLVGYLLSQSLIWNRQTTILVVSYRTSDDITCRIYVRAFVAHPLFFRSGIMSNEILQRRQQLKLPLTF